MFVAVFFVTAQTGNNPNGVQRKNDTYTVVRPHGGTPLSNRKANVDPYQNSVESQRYCAT